MQPLRKATALPRLVSSEAALESFTEAQEICPYDPGLLYNIARINQLLDNCQAALIIYEQAETQLKTGLTETSLSLETLREKKAEAEAQCELGELHVSCADEGVEVLLDGEAKPCPFSERLKAGSYQLEARLEGAKPWVREVELKDKESTRFEVPSLVKPAEAPPLESAEGAFPWAWSTLGLGLAVAATGLGLELWAGSIRAEVRDASTTEGVVTGMTRAEALDKRDQADALALGGVVGIGVGSALVVTGVVLLLLDSEDSASDTQVGVAVDEAGLYFGLGGRF